MDEKKRAHQGEEDAAGRVFLDKKNAVTVAKRAARSFSDIKLVEI